jgi:hypothetical protein
MTVVFSEGFDGYAGIAPGQKVEISLTAGRGVEYVLHSGGDTVTYDATPPRDGKWHVIKQVLMVDEHGNLYAKGPPEIED